MCIVEYMHQSTIRVCSSRKYIPITFSHGSFFRSSARPFKCCQNASQCFAKDSITSKSETLGIRVFYFNPSRNLRASCAFALDGNPFSYIFMPPVPVAALANGPYKPRGHIVPFMSHVHQNLQSVLLNQDLIISVRYPCRHSFKHALSHGIQISNTIVVKVLAAQDPRLLVRVYFTETRYIDVKPIRHINPSCINDICTIARIALSRPWIDI